MLDAERCILCSRCVRFCDEITGTGELGIFNRGDHSEIGLFPGYDLVNNYSANVVDICPVGALTDREFRFQVRVWYLDTAKSICTGCARGCNIDVHVNRRRPHHAEGRRVARLKPRFNADVNAWWICDVGRHHFGFVDEPTRLTVPTRRGPGGAEETSWEEAVAAVADTLRRHGPEQVGVLASPWMATEDLMALRRLLETLGITQVATVVPPEAEGDDFLLRPDRTPNRRGTELLGLGGDATALLAAARAGRVRVLWVFDHDLGASGWPLADVADALGRVESLLFTGSNANGTSERAHWALPAAAWVEREGTFTNFEGRVQRFRTAVEPLGASLPAWEMIGRVVTALGGTPAGTRAEHWFRDLAATVPVFAGLTYQAIGDTGRMIAGATSAGAPVPPGRRSEALATTGQAVS
jgi:NADH-quinone oxidoreductase subunit G